MVIDFASYAEENILYNACENVDAVVQSFRMLAVKLFKWFKDNQMKGNTDRFHLRLRRGDSNQIQIGDSEAATQSCS